jgi:hypothetical protein
VAVNVTVLPAPKLAEHVLPQLIPAGLDATEPDPEPASDTDKVCVAGANVAVTF